MKNVKKQLIQTEKQYKSPIDFNIEDFEKIKNRHGDIRERHRLISEDWGLERITTPENAKLYRQLINPQLDDTKKQAAAQQITEAFLEKVTTDKQWLSELATFTSFWMYS